MAERRDKKWESSCKRTDENFFFFHSPIMSIFFFSFSGMRLIGSYGQQCYFYRTRLMHGGDAGYGSHLPFFFNWRGRGFGTGLEDASESLWYKICYSMYVSVSPPVCHRWRGRSGKMPTAGCISSKCVHMRESRGQLEVNDFFFLLCLVCVLYNVILCYFWIFRE